MFQQQPSTPQKKKTSSRLSKHKRSKKQSGGIILQPRDVQIIQAVYDFRFLIRLQIQKLFFGSNSPHSKKKLGSGSSRAIDRLRKLFDHGYLDRQFFPRYTYGQVDPRSLTSKIYGSSPAIYCLYKKGVEVVAKTKEIPVREINWSLKKNKVKPSTLEHQLLINDLHITLLLCTQDKKDQKLETWLSDKECYHKYSRWSKRRGREEKKVFSPDAFFRYKIGNGYLSCFVEVDLATESIARRFKYKIENYKAYTKAGKYLEKYGQKKFRVLVITTTDARIKNLKKAAEKEGAESVFWFTTKDNIKHQPDFLTQPIFQRPGQIDPLPFYLPDKDYFKKVR